MDEDGLKVLLARGVSVEQIARRFEKDSSTVSYWMAKYGLQAPNRDKHAAKGGIARERLEELVGDGRSIAEIADAVGLSKATVRYWLGKHGLKTSRRRGPLVRAGTDEARSTGLVDCRLTCSTHGEVDAGCSRLLPLQEVPSRGRDPASTEREGDPGRGGGRTVRDLRL
jgi:transposase